MNKVLCGYPRPLVRAALCTHIDAWLYSQHRSSSAKSHPSVNQQGYKPAKDEVSEAKQSRHPSKHPASSEAPRKWQLENPGKTSEVMLKWRRENPERVEQNLRNMIEARLDSVRKKLTGEKLIHLNLRRHSDRPRLHVGISRIVVPAHVAVAWDLVNVPTKERLVKLTAHVTDPLHPHPHVWAQKSIEADDACRLALSVKHASHEPVWLTSDLPSAVAVGNAIVDFLTGKIKDPRTHIWTTDRFPFLGPWSYYVSADSWRESFDHPDKRRHALSRGETPKHSWKPTATYLRHYKTFDSVEQQGSGEAPPSPPTHIDPLNTPIPSALWVVPSPKKPLIEEEPAA